MPSFERNTLESMKYAELVKLAKEHEAYRRYAPKAELVEKLLALSEAETPVESLNDVSMPSFMENDDTGSDSQDHDENVTPEVTHKMPKGNTRKQKNKEVASPRPPLMDKGHNISSSIRRGSVDSNSASRSLAGPPKRRLNRIMKTSDQEASRKPISRRITRQRTFDIEESGGKICPPNQEETPNLVEAHNLKRDGTFDVESKNTPNLRREGTYEIESPEAGVESRRSSSRTNNLKRDRTFELDSSFNTRTMAEIDTPGKKGLNPPLVEIRVSHQKLPERTSIQSPFLLRKNSIASPSFESQIDKSKHEKSIPRRFVTTHPKRSPSLMAEVQWKKELVSAKKIADATGEKNSVVKKAPDFNAIHKRLFGKMESLVDSRQKVLDRANSMQKCQILKKPTPNSKVVRKLISPKVGKSKFASPKPQLKQAPSVFSANIVSIQKRPSVGSLIPGVSKLQSPKVVQFSSTASAIPKRIGVTKATEPARKEVLKAAVMGRKPIKRNSPMSKAKQCLQSVRLNKRFELQMKHRLAQENK